MCMDTEKSDINKECSYISFAAANNETHFYRPFKNRIFVLGLEVPIWHSGLF